MTFAHSQRSGGAYLSSHTNWGLNILNVYVPNGDRYEFRQKFKMEFLRHLRALTIETMALGPTIVLDDLNIVHTIFDVRNPHLAVGHSGFRSNERNWKSSLTSLGFRDGYTTTHPEPQAIPGTTLSATTNRVDTTLPSYMDDSMVELTIGYDDAFQSQADRHVCLHPLDPHIPRAKGHDELRAFDKTSDDFIRLQLEDPDFAGPISVIEGGPLPESP
ncbi:hypothetical protein HDU67_000160 [Dinochytrium kinnereticum]|nr:hypothetical protein HDU67_000160 [Dinochytrium kinnereticum]